MSSLFLILFLLSHSLCVFVTSAGKVDDSPTLLWPLPAKFTFGNKTLSVDPALSLVVGGSGGGSGILKLGFDRYREIIFENSHGFLALNRLRGKRQSYDINKLRIVVQSSNEDLQLGVDESYTLFVAKKDGKSVVGEATIEANTVYGALRALETFSQLCTFDYGSKSVQVYKAPWYIKDSPRFQYRGLLIDTSRHYLPIEVIKQIIQSMSYAKLNVLHWHVIDREAFPLEVPSYPKLWNGAYTKWERYTVEDAIEIVNFAKTRGVNVMAEVDVPGHAASWGIGYPDLWPSPSCKEPLDVSKELSLDVISGILTDMRKIFPFELFHLGGDEVDTTCWSTTRHVKQWLEERNMTTKDAYQYFVVKAQEVAISKNWSPVNWEETFDTFPTKLNPKTIVHNWLGSGVCPKAVAKGFRCIFSNQGVWYLDHLDVPWNVTYNAEPLEGITDISQQKLVIGGEVCMWGEKADTSDVQQTIWPRAAAAAPPQPLLPLIPSSVLRNDFLLFWMPLINRRKKQATGRNDFLLFWIPLINRRKKQAAWRNDFFVVLDTSYCFCHANRRKKQATGRDDVRRLGSVRSPNPTRICKIPIQRRAGRHTNLRSEKQRNIEATELSSISRSCSDLFTSFPLHFDPHGSLLIGANSQVLFFQSNLQHHLVGFTKIHYMKII